MAEPMGWVPDGVASGRARGVDAAPGRRPGVPMEAEPSQEYAVEPQWGGPEHLVRKGGAGLTPVYGTAQPPRGLSGQLRRAAYEIPEHEARHWLLLLAADRLDVLEHRLGRAATMPVRHPVVFVAAGLVAGALVGGALSRRR